MFIPKAYVNPHLVKQPIQLKKKNEKANHFCIDLKTLPYCTGAGGGETAEHQ